MNVGWSQKILRELFAQGVREAICCAGARNSPLVATLARSSGFSVRSFFEERSAGFFALGVARRTDRPVAIFTTSGTAAAELLPAAIEAFHTGVPLVLVTADRPRRLRGSGAPQSIDQTGLYAKFVDQEFDLENGELFSLREWKRRAPVHINVCFDEPLLDEPMTELKFLQPGEAPAVNFAGTCAVAPSAPSPSVRLREFLRRSGPLVVVVSTLETAREREAVAGFLVQLNAPLYLESTSGLRERPELQGLSLRSGERLLEWALKNNLVSRVLRVGGVPTVRIWRDLDDSKSAIEVLSLSALPFAGLSRGEFICADIASVLGSLLPANPYLHSNETAALFAKDRTCEPQLLALFAAEPASEPSMVRAFSRLISPGDLLYLGNSLPIRQVDLAAMRDHQLAAQANRGVNGIDGQVSTFLGLCGGGQVNWALVGDLTALYDLSAPWALQARENLSVRLVIVNNGGGRIFSRIFGDALFENRHTLDFENWAKMWGLGYSKWTRVPESPAYRGATREVIEIVPDEEATQRFWSRYDDLWKP